jgi:hypothetical protein
MKRRIHRSGIRRRREPIHRRQPCSTRCRAKKPLIVGDALPDREVIPAPEQLVSDDGLRSFRASDCIYQPYGGRRRFCEKGARPREVPERASKVSTQTRAQQRNLDVCARIQPIEGVHDNVVRVRPFGHLREARPGRVVQ